MRTNYAILFGVLAVCLIGWSGQARAETYQMWGRADLSIPADCQYWHEVAGPDSLHQDDYGDAAPADGNVSLCDYIQLDGEWYHVVSGTFVAPDTLRMVTERMVPATNTTGLVALVILLVLAAGLLLTSRMRARAAAR